MASGIRFTRTGRGSINGQPFRDAGRELQNAISEELEDAGADGLLEAREVIESSGTSREWSGPFQDRNGVAIRTGSGPGRIATGNMLDALDYRVYKGAGVGIDVGWIHPAMWEEYFAIQDKGFEAGGFRADRTVAGMGMIAHMKHYMDARVDRAIDRGIERALDAI